MQFAAFKCRQFRQPWTEPPEDLIRRNLAEALEQRRVFAIGGIIEGKLVGLAAWGEEPGEPEHWNVPVLAVAEGHGGRGYGLLLKTHLVEIASQSGIKQVSSLVHRDNRAMLKINQSLGASVMLDPKDPWKLHFLCEIHPHPHPLGTPRSPR